VNPSRRKSLLVAVVVAGFLMLVASDPAHAQLIDTDIRVEVHDLPALLARSRALPDVLLASMEMIFHENAVCCAKNSALEDSMAAADPSSLKDVAVKLQGKHQLSDGHSIQVTAEFWAADAVNGGTLIAALKDQHAPLMLWNSRLYVVYGAVYRWVRVGTPGEGIAERTVVRRLLLWDPLPENTHNIEFNRETDDLSKVQGLLYLEYKRQ